MTERVFVINIIGCRTCGTLQWTGREYNGEPRPCHVCGAIEPMNVVFFDEVLGLSMRVLDRN